MKSFYLFVFVLMSSVIFGQKNNEKNNEWGYTKTTSLSKKDINFIKKGFPKKLNEAI